MTMGINHTTLGDMLSTLNTQIGTSATLTIYNGTQPATGGTATTALAALTCSSSAFGVVSGVTLTANAIANATASNTSTATWFRIATSGGTQQIDGTVGTSGADLNLNTTSIVSGATVSVTSCVITAGNQ